MKIESVNKIFLFWHWQWLEKYFFRNKTFLLFKLESWNFQHLFEIKFHKTSQNFISIRQWIEKKQLSEWVEILLGFMKFYFKQMLISSAFYKEKQKSFIPKKRMNIVNLFFSRSWCFCWKSSRTPLNSPMSQLSSHGFGSWIQAWL